MQIEAGFAFITDTPREGRVWQEGVPKEQRPRKVNDNNVPLHEVNAQMRLPLLDWTEVTLQAPDSQVAAMAKGALVTFTSGVVVARGGDFGSIKATVTVEHLTPAGDGVAALEEAARKAAAQGAKA